MKGTPHYTRQEISAYNFKKIKDTGEGQEFQGRNILFKLVVGHGVGHDLPVMLILFMLFPFRKEVLA